MRGRAWNRWIIARPKLRLNVAKSPPVAVGAARSRRADIITRPVTSSTAIAPEPGDSNEAHISTEHPAEKKGARVPDAYAHPGRARPHLPPARQRPRLPVGLKGRRGVETISSAREFRTVYRRARRGGGEGFSVAAMHRGDPGPSRFGFSVPREVGGAVRRNRARRQLREIARSTPVPAGWDLVLTARRDWAGFKFQDLQVKISQILGDLTSGQDSR
jgi:ribonuclease P protein component